MVEVIGQLGISPSNHTFEIFGEHVNFFWIKAIKAFVMLILYCQSMFPADQYSYHWDILAALMHDNIDPDDNHGICV